VTLGTAIFSGIVSQFPDGACGEVLSGAAVVLGAQLH